MIVPFFSLPAKCKIKSPRSKIIGNKAGYIIKLLTRSPFSNNTKLLWMPQPGQSKPVSSLRGQGIWCPSSQDMIPNKYIF